MRAKDIMTTPVITVGPEAHLKDVARLLIDRGIAAVPVVDQDEELIGIVSERDLLPLETAPDPRRRILAGRARRSAPALVREVMTRDVVTLPETADVAEVARLMLRRRVKRIPIVAGNRVVGIVSRRDVLKVFARTDAEVLAELEELLDDKIVMLGRFRAEVRDGTVTLTGPTDRPGRHLVEILARSVPGVVAVRFAEGS